MKVVYRSSDVEQKSVQRFLRHDPLAFKYFSSSPYNYVNNNPIGNIDPDGKEIIGVTKGDAKKAKDDILEMFKDEKFANFRNLITLDKKGKKFNSIDQGALATALEGMNGPLNEDEQALIDMVTNTINSKDQHLVEYAPKDKNISNIGQDIMSKNLPSALVDPVVKANNGLPASILSAFGGSGTTVKTEKGSYTILIDGLDASKSGTDYYNNNTKTYGNNPAGRPATFGHELFGHGRSLALGRDASHQHVDAIQTENMILRVMGHGSIQRDGTGHGPRVKITDASKLPNFR